MRRRRLLAEILGAPLSGWTVFADVSGAWVETVRWEGSGLADAPYGTIRITRGATTTEHAFNTGCFDADYARFVAVLKEADTLVATWGKAAPVSRTESAGQSGS